MDIVIKCEVLPATKQVIYSCDIGQNRPPTAMESQMAEILARHIGAGFAEIGRTVACASRFRTVVATTESGINAGNRMLAEAIQREYEQALHRPGVGEEEENL